MSARSASPAPARRGNAARKPTISRPLSYPLLAAQVALLAGLTALAWWLLRPPRGLTALGAALVVWLVFGQMARMLLLGPHRRAMVLTRRRRLDNAIAAWQASHDYFTRLRWIERWRWAVLLSPAAVGYREMALYNLGFCLIHAQRPREALEAYRRLLAEHPATALRPRAEQLARALDRELDAKAGKKKR